MQGFVAIIVHVDLLVDTPKSEFVSDHKGIHVIVLWQIRIGFLKFTDLFGIEHMDFSGIPAQLSVLAEGVDQIVSVNGRGFHADYHSLQPLGFERRHNLLRQQFSTALIILHGKTTVFLSVRLHQVNCVVLASHVNANE